MNFVIALQVIKMILKFTNYVRMYNVDDDFRGMFWHDKAAHTLRQ